MSFILKDGVCAAKYNKHFILSDRPRFWYWCVFVCIGFDFVLWNVNEFQLEFSFKVLEPSCKKINLSDSWVALSHAIFYLQYMFTMIIKNRFFKHLNRLNIIYEMLLLLWIHWVKTLDKIDQNWRKNIYLHEFWIIKKRAIAEKRKHLDIFAHLS